jgi:hypothetical protein
MTDVRGEDPVERHVVDGNALAGELQMIFGTDMTNVPGQCVHCGTVSAVAQLRAYIQAPGKVLRCPACGGVVIRVVETPEAIYVDARGAAYLRIDRR